MDTISNFKKVSKITALIVIQAFLSVEFGMNAGPVVKSASAQTTTLGPRVAITSYSLKNSLAIKKEPTLFGRTPNNEFEKKLADFVGVDGSISFRRKIYSGVKIVTIQPIDLGDNQTQEMVRQFYARNKSLNPSEDINAFLEKWDKTRGQAFMAFVSDVKTGGKVPVAFQIEIMEKLNKINSFEENMKGKVPALRNNVVLNLKKDKFEYELSGAADKTFMKLYQPDISDDAEELASDIKDALLIRSLIELHKIPYQQWNDSEPGQSITEYSGLIGELASELSRLRSGLSSNEELEQLEQAVREATITPETPYEKVNIEKYRQLESELSSRRSSNAKFHEVEKKLTAIKWVASQDYRATLLHEGKWYWVGAVNGRIKEAMIRFTNEEAMPARHDRFMARLKKVLKDSLSLNATRDVTLVMTGVFIAAAVAFIVLLGGTLNPPLQDDSFKPRSLREEFLDAMSGVAAALKKLWAKMRSEEKGMIKDDKDNPSPEEILERIRAERIRAEEILNEQNKFFMNLMASGVAPEQAKKLTREHMATVIQGATSKVPAAGRIQEQGKYSPLGQFDLLAPKGQLSDPLGKEAKIEALARSFEIMDGLARKQQIQAISTAILQAI